VTTEGSDMPTLEERVTALEERVELLAEQNQHTGDLAMIAARDALTAREAHQRNIELLNALRKTQAEHTQILAQHTQMLAQHTQILTGHTQRLDSIDSKLGGIAVGMHALERLLNRLAADDETDGDST
jgi:cell division septum initiation protein DivIVA